MALTQITYTDEHFLQIRDFLVDTYNLDSAHHNWQIDRWNFCRHVSQVIHETREGWPDTVGVWVDETGIIQAVVNSGGEKRGDAFLQLGSRSFSDEELGEFLDHAEDKLSITGEDSRRQLYPWIGPGFQQLIRILEKRGYHRTGNKEPAGCIEITDRLDVVLPQGLDLVDGTGFNDEERGVAHSLAFGYAREGALDEYHIVEAFRNMRQAPDYRSELDLTILTREGNVAAFANFWYDIKNRFGMLEPLGTIPAYQRQGLARALLFEGINRLHELGATRLYGPANQEFYLRIGFIPVYHFEIWEKWDDH